MNALCEIRAVQRRVMAAIDRLASQRRANTVFRTFTVFWIRKLSPESRLHRRAGAYVRGFNPVCQVTPVILHGVVERATSARRAEVRHTSGRTFTGFRFSGLLLESQNQNLALTVLYVQHSLDSGRWREGVHTLGRTFTGRGASGL